MIEAGRIALIIALPVAAFSIFASVRGARLGSDSLYKSARYGILGVFGLYTLALALVLYAFFAKDFGVKVVAEHVSSDLPGLYTLSALYAGKSGSMFLWGWLISLFSAVLVWRTGRADRRTMPWAIAILAVIEIFYMALVTFAGDVFTTLASPLSDGYGLNPLLQNFGMLVHPPLLYIGFAGFAVVFALVVGGLIARRPGTENSVHVRRWALFAWVTLGVGNVVGMWWSYNELGWGGYWAWDPVENAGLMPWLLGTAFLHATAVRGRRDYLTAWGYNLAVFTFVFTLMSPFITHGGIESPLHGFYGSPFPPYILAIMLLTVIGGMVLLYYRRSDITSSEKLSSWVSREGAFQLTSIILVVLVFLIFLGTVLPHIVEGLGGTQLALERDFFDRTAGPVMLLLVLLMGICPLLGRVKTVWRSVKRNSIFVLLAVIIVVVAVAVSGIGNWYIAAILLGGLVLFVIFREWWRGTAARRRNRGGNWFGAFVSFIDSNKARYGGFLAHIGIVLITLGIIASSFYSLEKTETLDIGETMSIGGYRLTYDELVFRQDMSKINAEAEISVSRNGREVATLHPSYAYWFGYDDFYAEVAVRTTAAEDLFVSLMWTNFDPDDPSAIFRVLVNPLVVWIWIGGGFFLLGGALAFAYREKQPKGSET